MIRRIFPKTTGDFTIIETDDGQSYQVSGQQLVIADKANHEALADIPEAWELVDDAVHGTDLSHDSHPDQVVVISSIDASSDDAVFTGRTEQGGKLPLTAVELKTILNAMGTHNAKLRGIEP